MRAELIARGDCAALVPTRNVLVCDDDPRVRRAVVRALRRLGYAVSMAGSGDEALALLRERSRKGLDSIGVLLADISMPGMDGPELAVRARGVAPIDVVFMSGHGENAAEVVAVRGQGYPLLPKPFDEEQLVAALSPAPAPRWSEAIEPERGAGAADPERASRRGGRRERFTNRPGIASIPREL